MDRQVDNLYCLCTDTPALTHLVLIIDDNVIELLLRPRKTDRRIKRGDLLDPIQRDSVPRLLQNLFLRDLVKPKLFVHNTGAKFIGEPVIVFKIDRRTELFDDDKSFSAFMIDQHSDTVMNLDMVPCLFFTALNVMYPLQFEKMRTCTWR